MSNSPLDQVAIELWNTIKDRDCVAWVGSGLSKLPGSDVRTGYPDWPETVKEICRACGVPPLSVDANLPDKLIDKAEECKIANAQAYHSTLARIFGRPVTETRAAYPWLMAVPFRGYVTTNFDPLLLDAGQAHGLVDHYAYPDLPTLKLGASPKAIFYLHGLARHNNTPRGENLVLARSDFDKAYNKVIRPFIDSMLRELPILFLGCSLEEPPIQEAFRRVRDIQLQIEQVYPGRPRPKRFILIPSRYTEEDSGYGRMTKAPDKSAEESEERRFDDLGIKVIRYEPQDKQRHFEIEEILRNLCELYKLSKSENVPS